MNRAFFPAYLAGDPSACVFLASDFRDRTTRIKAARLAAERTLSPSLLEVLRQQQADLPPSPAREGNLTALAAGGTAVVVTGQQVGLFLGPLYTAYKAASAVAVARALQAESGVRCVPLFWLQTEDHDFAEIAGVTVAGRDGKPVALSLDAEPAGGETRVSVAHRVLGPEISTTLAALADALPEVPAAGELLALLRAHYRPGRPLAAAFAGVLAALFADEGLLILDPRDARIAALAAPLYRTALETTDEIAGALAERGAALSDAGFAEQVPVRHDCSLLFFHRDGPVGPRFRLERRGAGWVLSGAPGTLTADAVRELLVTQPLRFSTSALLRPVVQDALLPAAAYVGGPGEINYFAQLAPLYDHFGVQPALVVPRARFRCLDARSRRLLSQLGMQVDDLALTPAELRLRMPVAVPAGMVDPNALRGRAAEQIIPAVDQLARAVEALDPQLVRPAQRTRATVTRALNRLLDRYGKTLAERDQIAAGRLEGLRQALYPGGVPQERYYGWPSLAGRIGSAAFKRLVLDRLDSAGPFSAQPHDLHV